MKYTLLICFYFGINQTFAEECSRPNNLKSKEEYCWKAEVELVERIQQTSKSVLNFAKKKLGMEVEEQNEPQKCSYYQCQLSQLQLINQKGFPIMDNFEKWIANEVVYEQAKQLLNQLNKCNDALSKATATDTQFNGDFINLSVNNQTEADMTPESTTQKAQSDCELAAEFVKCLSHLPGCPVFLYP
ncbi:uncharacterized protein LOC109595555 [Aethina tumida]|uniref:uncharacterized protein LOC109595555 n=1 Tax=Aethina tumida TaxID=116153 RepID=UPI00096B59A8|nr:uncharacterized protein LOC109595555 [Aethina tumida]